MSHPDPKTPLANLVPDALVPDALAPAVEAYVCDALGLVPVPATQVISRDRHAEYLWAWVDGKPIVNRPRTMADLPARTELSDRVGKDLKKRGFNFVGSMIVYSYLQAVGLVNDHLVTCPKAPR